MSENAVYVDGMLLDWGATLFNQRAIAPVKPKKGLTGLKIAKKPPAGRGGGLGQGVSPTVIRSKLGSITKKPPEVMVKISGGGKGIKQIKAHMEYISRNGQLELEDQDGERLKGRESLRDLADEWQVGGLMMIPEEGSTREAFNIVLSMPAGTDPLAVKRAARDFAAQEFGGHEYVMVLHTFDTDPDRSPSKNPHVHLCVKAASDEGVRLNPRKADLQRWREGFAEALRGHGVEAAATKREQRLLRTQSPKVTKFKSAEKQLAKAKPGRAGRAPTKVRRTDPAEQSVRAAKAKRTEADVKRGYRNIATALARSESPDDHSLALALVDRLAQMRPLESTRAEREPSRDSGTQR